MKQCAHAMKVPWTSENIQRSTDEHLTAVCYSDMHAYCRTKLVRSYDCSYSRCYGLHASALQLTRRSRKLGAGFTSSAAHTVSLESKNAIQLTSAHAISIAPAQAEYEIKLSTKSKFRQSRYNKRYDLASLPLGLHTWQSSWPQNSSHGHSKQCT